ncbi:MAG: hypothetical protein JKP90_10105 [Desulfofustis sp. PB-SRB1]|nr:hypothetical protein [Desulfofustis sp. PB-SRB1]
MKPEQTIQFLAELLELAEELNRIVKQYCRLVTTDHLDTDTTQRRRTQNMMHWF